MHIYQGDIVRVDFEVPWNFDPARHTNTLFNTGVSMEFNMTIGEPSLWSSYKGKIGWLFLAGLLGYTCYKLFKEAKSSKSSY
jgi:hypothetical protein